MAPVVIAWIQMIWNNDMKSNIRIGYEPIRQGHFQHILFSGLATVSLLIAMTTSVLWMRSGSHGDIFTIKVASKSFVQLYSTRGGVQLVRWKNLGFNNSGIVLDNGWNITDPLYPLPRKAHLGFRFFNGVLPIAASASNARLFVIVVPFVVVILGTLVLPFLWVALYLRRWRKKRLSSSEKN